MEPNCGVFGLCDPMMYAVFVPTALFLLLFLLRISRSLMSPMGADTILLLIGADVLVPTGQLDVSGVLRLPGNVNATFMIFILLGFVLIAATAWLEEQYYRILGQLAGEPQHPPFRKDVITLFMLLLTYIPSGMFMAMHIALIVLYPVTQGAASNP